MSDQPPHSLSIRTLRGAAWLFASSWVRAILSIAIVAVLSRILTPLQFGVVGAALVVIGLAERLAEAGLNHALVQVKDLTQAHVRTAFTLTMTVSAIFGAATAISAEPIGRFFGIEELPPVLRVMALLFPLDAIAGTSKRLLQREMRFRHYGAADVLSTALGFGLVGIVSAVLGAGVWSLVFAHFGQTFVMATYCIIAQPHSLRLQIDRGALRDLVRVGGGFALTEIFTYCARRGDNLMVGKLLGASALGLYGRAYALMDQANQLIASVVQTAMFPAASRVQQDVERLRLGYVRGLAITFVIFIPSGAVAALLAPEIIGVLLGSQWSPAIGPFQILAAGMSLRAGFKLSSTILQAKGAVYRMARLEFVYAMVVIGGAAIGSQWGVSGVATSTLVGVAVSFFLTAGLAMKVCGIRRRDLIGISTPGVRLALASVAVVAPPTLLCRHYALPQILTLGVAMALLAIMLLALARRYGRQLFGEHGVWLIQSISIPLSRRFLPR
ncbi:MAG: lipopolysaccharide biosynthesis protein [Actinomycetota bacterium]